MKIKRLVTEITFTEIEVGDVFYHKKSGVLCIKASLTSNVTIGINLETGRQSVIRSYDRVQKVDAELKYTTLAV